MKTLRYKTEVLSCVAHFLVDLTCTACLGRLSSRLSYDSIIACAILYNALAFAFQLPIGALADFLGITRILAAAGCFLVALGALFPQPLPLCLLIGLGNACFHVGAGREALQFGGAAPVGRFVAPVALGIFFGPRLAGFPLLRLLLPILLILSGLLVKRRKTTSHLSRMIFHASSRHSSASSRKKSEVMQTLSISPLCILYCFFLSFDNGYLNPVFVL